MTLQTPQRHLVVHEVTKKKVKLEIPILLNGKVQHRVEKLTATWIDPKTGDKFTEKEARALGYPAFDYGIMILQKEYVLSKLRKEVRNFADFVLQFRNERRSLTPGINELCEWYAIYTGKRADHVRRYIPGLVEVGILVKDNPDALMPLFQYNDKSAKSVDVVSEMFAAVVKFDTMLMKKWGVHPLFESVKPNFTRPSDVDLLYKKYLQQPVLNS